MSIRLLASRTNFLASISKATSQPALRCYATKKYTPHHQWISLDKRVGTVGITNHAQEALGEVSVVLLPEVGMETEIDGEMGYIESVKANCDIYSPVSGKVTAINGILTDEPGLVNESPEKEGWLYKLEVAEEADAEIANLMDAEAYHEFCISKEEENKSF
ncbi:hypothetical protein [Absidia glauca]|uniref:Glycine cleavage system H protein n=1 Tax=Absidia glauca TaxID=4829 RepID=A0A163IYF8_ABSGL|nr:hypothetical protein [Absidia glauca]